MAVVMHFTPAQWPHAPKLMWHWRVPPVTSFERIWLG